MVFAAGAYATLEINEKSGTPSLPIVFRSTSGATFSANSHESGHGIRVRNSSCIQLDGLTARSSLFGIMLENVSDSEIRGCTVTDIGQEAIHIRKGTSHIVVERCTIADTGRRAGATDEYQGIPTEVYAEGIYIGTGASGGEDDGTHHVTVRHCDIFRTRAEAIDMKRGLHDIVVEGNRIWDIRTKVRAAINVMDFPTGAEYNYVVRNNMIWNVRGARYDADGVAIRIFGGGVECDNNVIWNCGYAGIRSENDRGGVRRIRHNTVHQGGTEGDIVIVAGEVEVRNNIGSLLAGNIASTVDLFIDAAGGDFRLAPAAFRAIDAGPCLSVAGTDFDGIARPQGSACDMGAFERADQRN